MGDTRKYRNIDALRTFGCLAIIAWHVKANTGFSTGGGGYKTRVYHPFII